MHKYKGGYSKYSTFNYFFVYVKLNAKDVSRWIASDIGIPLQPLSRGSSTVQQEWEKDWLSENRLIAVEAKQDKGV